MIATSQRLQSVAAVCIVVFVVVMCGSASGRRGTVMNSRIVGGLPTNGVPVPYMVSLTVFGSHICGGAIINELTVLSAAHCLASTTSWLLKVHVGAETKSFAEGEVFAVAELVIHEQWTQKTMDYDVGLVRLRSPLTFNGLTIQPIPIVNADYVLRVGSYATVYGWGYQKMDGDPSDTLRYARIPIVDQANCRRMMGRLAITDRMVCAGLLAGGVDACQMDSGGPLVYDEKLIGVVSWGVGCALPGKPGVYARLTELRPWLEHTMKWKYNESL